VLLGIRTNCVIVSVSCLLEYTKIISNPPNSNILYAVRKAGNEYMLAESSGQCPVFGLADFASGV
jgi:hypothetical protein